jgi:hypothetical protein
MGRQWSTCISEEGTFFFFKVKRQSNPETNKEA